MKRVVTTVLMFALLICLVACGNSYECARCDKKTSKAYYDIDGKKDYVLCADCAEEYWAPFDYEQYRVK